MALSPLAGKDVTYQVNSTAYHFKASKVDMKGKLGEVTGSTSNGFRIFIGGPVDAKITLSGPRDAGNQPFTVNNSYVFDIVYSASVTLHCTALVENIKIDTDVDNPVGVEVMIQTSGSFTASIT